MGRAKVHGELGDSCETDITVMYYVNSPLHYIICGRVQKFVLPCLCPNLYCNERILEYLYPSPKSDGPLHLTRSSHTYTPWTSRTQFIPKYPPSLFPSSPQMTSKPSRSKRLTTLSCLTTSISLPEVVCMTPNLAPWALETCEFV